LTTTARASILLQVPYKNTYLGFPISSYFDTMIILVVDIPGASVGAVVIKTEAPSFLYNKGHYIWQLLDKQYHQLLAFSGGVNDSFVLIAYACPHQTCFLPD